MKLSFLIVAFCSIVNVIDANDGRNVIKEIGDSAARSISAMGEDMKPLKKKLKEIGKSLVKNEAENLEKDSGVKESKEGDWEVKRREKVEKHHQDGVKSYKAGVSEVKDKGNERTHEKAHEVRKMAVSVRGTDPQMEKNGNFFRSVLKTQMVQKSWERSADDQETQMAANPGKFTMRNDFPDQIDAEPIVIPAWPLERSTPLVESRQASPQRLQENRQEDANLLEDLEGKVKDSLKDDITKERFRHEMDAIEKAHADPVSLGYMMKRRTDDDFQVPVDDEASMVERQNAEAAPKRLLGLNKAAPAMQMFAFYRRPTYFIH